jgi:negative regulator of genetic competence, sporulation and motility
MKRAESDKEKINQLSELVQKLEIKQQDIHNDIKQIKKIINELNNTKQENIKNEDKPIRAYAVVKPDIGDTVRIKNPCGKQQNQGTVVGYTKTGYVKIQIGDNGQVVRRIPSNLLKLEPYE